MLTRQPTGHWNAFGMAYDLDGNLFSTDNDANATPPNRLLHVIPGANFGFEYRYGRSGRHPLQCWYGENPGTLGIICALGEAACGLTAHGPRQLLSASWTDNRIDIHSLEPKGASFVASREPFLSGPDDFRPVHFSYFAAGNYLYFTDWVKISFPVHGHGRIWRVEFKQSVPLEPSPRNAEKQRLSPEDALTLLGSEDPYARTEAIHVLAEHPDVLVDYKWQDTSAIAPAHYAVALKRLDSGSHVGIIPAILVDADPGVRFVGIKWISDEGIRQYRPNLEGLLDRSDLSRHDLRAVVAALAKISGDSKKEFSPDDTLLELALDAGKPSGLRAMALQGVDIAHKRLTVDALTSLTRSKELSIQREAVRSLARHSDAARVQVLGEIATNESLDANLRADAIAGLAAVVADQAELLETLDTDANKTVSAEAFRTLVSAGLVMRKLKGKPPVDDLKAWQELVAEATGEAETAVGRRLFFHSKLGGCFRCHAKHGRGNSIGPDLTTIRNQSGITQHRLLQHVVNPDAEMAPCYRPQVIVTVDGKVLTGLIVGKEGKKQAYVGTNGAMFFVDKEDVNERRELTTSIMPRGLLDKMDANEIRGLIAYLLKGELE